MNPRNSRSLFRGLRKSEWGRRGKRRKPLVSLMSLSEGDNGRLPEVKTAGEALALPPRLAEICTELREVPRGRDRLLRLVEMGRRLRARLQTEGGETWRETLSCEGKKVRGCASTVYVRVLPSETETGHFEIGGFSDALVSGGLLAVLCLGLSSGANASEIRALKAHVVGEESGMLEVLPSERVNGLENILTCIVEQIETLDCSSGESQEEELHGGEAKLNRKENRSVESEERERQSSVREESGETADARLLPESALYLPSTPDSVAVLLSGGVDSSVALHILKDQGRRVTAFYLKIWLEDELSHLNQCPWAEDLRFARSVSEQAGVQLEELSLQDAYRQGVVRYVVDEARKGRTPNPDVLCNSRVKFGVFLDQVGPHFQSVASGHYAQSDRNGEGGRVRLLRSRDRIKDQTYFLCSLQQRQLEKTLFPLGGLTKKEVRDFALSRGLATQFRKDSQGICFLGKLRFSDFLQAHLGTDPGPVLSRDTGEQVGEHNGLWFHTVGQRKGLGPLLRAGIVNQGPFFVCGKDRDRNALLISNRYEEEVSRWREERTVVELDSLHWVSGLGRPPLEWLHSDTAASRVNGRGEDEDGGRIEGIPVTVQLRHGAREKDHTDNRLPSRLSRSPVGGLQMSAQAGKTRLPRVAIVGGGVSGISCGRRLLELFGEGSGSKGLRQKDKQAPLTIFDTGKTALGGRCSSRVLETKEGPMLFDHAAQCFSVAPRKSGQTHSTTFEKWASALESEGVLFDWQKEGAAEPPSSEGGEGGGQGTEIQTASGHRVVVLCKGGSVRPVGGNDIDSRENGRQPGGGPAENETDKERERESCRLLAATDGMRSFVEAFARPVEASVDAHVWISKCQWDTTAKEWELWHYQEPKGRFDYLVIAHNGKCAARLMSSAGAGFKDVTQALTVRFGAVPRGSNPPEMQLNSLYVYLLYFSADNQKKPPTDLTFDAAFVEGVPELSWVSENVRKLGGAKKTSGSQCWTLISSPAFGEVNKLPQEFMPEEEKKKVETALLSAFERALGASPGSLQPDQTFLQLWGAANPVSVLDADTQTPFIFDGRRGVGVCGDWCAGGASVPAAAESGVAVAEAIAADWAVRGSGEATREEAQPVNLPATFRLPSMRSEVPGSPACKAEGSAAIGAFRGVSSLPPVCTDRRSVPKVTSSNKGRGGEEAGSGAARRDSSTERRGGSSERGGFSRGRGRGRGGRGGGRFGEFQQHGDPTVSRDRGGRQEASGVQRSESRGEGGESWKPQGKEGSSSRRWRPRPSE
uniref:tRNA-5-taurinomethyluridine 2-sulfurtransferase n=1 Tax=Chromera velia CCMP2878 TaxID=1169474 RepID=A0A0G4I6I9_9ALVE|eukprot:Cvel_11406.t1-p1 / transcript=Cvel_11406.t1 / gene=Cvel_11406 / organism=Chromera_velia_CCMP2878 / gene_product=tRNA-specific 2-thiouridylase MnmA, putative / transcript_product=tRNA-specific 2-thiouridylase MnmA, putative / location=Cvel_scaffold716:26517-37151(+) / protein_length=1265 / sequence_SO=supercontig / SO=protein_coding / is_pseudo=false